MDTVKAVVQKVIPEGEHGPFAVATSGSLQGSVTFSLEPTVWQEEEWPEQGMVVLLGKLREKRAGWRAKEGRFWNPSDEQKEKIERSRTMAEEFNLYWDGMLTVENIEQVAALLRQLLTGKRYTFVAVNELRSAPEVRTSQKLEPGISGDPINVYYDKEGKQFAGLSAHDSHGVWICSTNLHGNKHDPEFNNPYIVFEGNKVTITHRARAGNKLCWVVAIEREHCG